MRILDEAGVERLAGGGSSLALLLAALPATGGTNVLLVAETLLMPRDHRGRCLARRLYRKIFCG